MEAREFAGLRVVVENPAGSTRQWHDREGRESGSTKMLHDYGFLEGHVGVDGDEVDCYLGPDELARFVYVVHQLAAPDFKRHDEDKCMLGFADEASAKAAYLAHRNDGERAYGGMTAIPLEAFKAKLARRTGTGKIRHEMTLFRIEHRDSRWYVVSEAGKPLGDYATEGEAKERLRQVEAAKAAKASVMSRAQSRVERILFAGRAMMFESGVPGGVRVGVWDRFTSWGEKVKDGRTTVFDEVSLGQMVRNWAARGDALAMCYNHQSAFVEKNGQPAPSLAFYGALAVVRGGQAIQHATTLTDASPFTGALADLIGREDGLYGLRTEVTPLGQELLPNFKFISPMFQDEGFDEQGREIGYVIYDVAATNTPFQAGCEITFERGTKPQEGATRMAAKLSALSRHLRLEADADDKSIRSALSKFESSEAMKSMEEEGYDYEGGAAHLEEMARAYEDAHYEEGPEDEKLDHPAIMRKMAAKFRRMAKMAAGDPPFGGKETPEEEAAEEKAMKHESEKKDEEKMEVERKRDLAALAARLGVSLSAGATSAQMLSAVSAAAFPASKIPELVKAQVDRQLLERDAARERADAAARAKQLTDAAIAGGFPEQNRKALESFASDPNNFEAARAMARPYLSGASSMLFERVTLGGAPLASDPRSAAEPAVAKPRVVRNQLGTFVEDDTAFAKVAKEYADAKDGPIKLEIDALLPDEAERNHPGYRLMAANRLAKQKRPDLWEAAELGDALRLG